MNDIRKIDTKTDTQGGDLSHMQDLCEEAQGAVATARGALVDYIALHEQSAGDVLWLVVWALEKSEAQLGRAISTAIDAQAKVAA